MKNASHDPNRSLVRIFCLSLGGLLFAYATIAVYVLLALENPGWVELAVGVFRIVFGFGLGLLFCWGWLAEPLQRQVRLMGALFEADYENLSSKTRIRALAWLFSRKSASLAGATYLAPAE